MLTPQDFTFEHRKNRLSKAHFQSSSPEKQNHFIHQRAFNFESPFFYPPQSYEP